MQNEKELWAQLQQQLQQQLGRELTDDDLEKIAGSFQVLDELLKNMEPAKPDNPFFLILLSVLLKKHLSFWQVLLLLFTSNINL